ncbi:MAG: hypothetical protein L6Q98_17445 [Anaerolineae bacterium]|nr:hypothetical protein [Anaerolineae bacterium]
MADHPSQSASAERTSYHIEVRLTGREFSAERVHARDAAALIAAVEALLTAVLPQIAGAPAGENDVVISLAELRPTGYALVFTAPQSGVVERAFAHIAETLRAGRVDALPARAVDGVREIRRIARKYAVEVEFAGRSGRRGTQRAAVVPDTRIDSPVVVLHGTTSLYGVVVRVGGEEPPRARLRLINGRTLTCELAHRRSWALARELGGRLYQLVGVRGEAITNTADRSLISFRIDRLLPYSMTGIDRALNGIAEAAGDSFAGLPDDLTSGELSMRSGGE